MVSNVLYISRKQARKRYLPKLHFFGGKRSTNGRLIVFLCAAQTGRLSAALTVKLVETGALLGP